MDSQKIDLKKALKSKSPMNDKTMSGKLGKCVVCNTLANGAFCSRCITAGFKDKYDEDPDSIHKGLWQTNSGGEAKFLPFKKKRNPINKISSNASDMDKFKR